MTSLTAQTTPTSTAAPTADSRRIVRAAAGCLVAAPVLLLAAHLLQPSHGTSTEAEVAAQAAHRGAFTASTIVGLVAMVAVLPAVLALGSLVRTRWSGRVGTPLALLGATGLTFLLGTGVGSTVIAAEGGPQAVALTDALESDPAFGVAVGLMLIGWTFGLITLAVGLGRARVIPWWGAGAIALAAVLPAVAGGKAGVAAGFVLLLGGFVAAARALLRSAS